MAAKQNIISAHKGGHKGDRYNFRKALLSQFAAWVMALYGLEGVSIDLERTANGSRLFAAETPPEIIFCDLLPNCCLDIVL